MYLKGLEIQGFKSFAEKTYITFEKEITGIVGPNGSGKSNISDAMLWVMGEQRSKALRGGKMEDVIFGGTEKRSPMGFAQVSLILDNSAGIFNIDTPEVVITRRYYRTGESEYSINRETVRLKDVYELLMDTGLGRDGYSVIGQGRISEIVSAKSTDRREVFEEAAGISRYRHRKEEAERKLKGTEDNLLRINDKIDELEMQVTPLKKQAEVAKKYLVLREEQRVLEISVWMQNLDTLHEKTKQLTEDCDKANRELEKTKAELQRMYADGEAYSEKIREYDIKSEEIRAKKSAVEAECAELDSEIAVLKANLSHSRENIQRINAEMGEQAQRAENIRAQIADNEDRVRGIEDERLETERKIGDIITKSEENSRSVGSARSDLSDLVAEENRLNESLSRSTTMVTMLEERIGELNERKNTIDGDISSGEEKYDEICRQLANANKELSAAKEKFDEVNNIISGHRMRMGGREKNVSDLSDKLNKLTVEARSAEGRVNMLADMEKEFEGLGKAVRSVMQGVNRGNLRGEFWPMAGIISTDDRFAVAIETAMGGAMQNIVTDTQASGKAAIDYLKRTDGGRTTFVPLDVTKPNSLRRVPEGDEGYLGVAADLVKYDRRFDNVIRNILGRTVVAETLADAVRMSKKFDNQLRIVSLDGQLINAGGSMTGGSAARNVGILSRANELKKLRERLEKLRSEESTCSQQLADAKRELAAAKYEMEVASSELGQTTDAYHRARSTVDQLKLLQTAADESIESLENEKNGLNSRIKENSDKLTDAKQETAESEAKLSEIREKIAEASEGCDEFEKVRQELLDELAQQREKIAALISEKDALAKAKVSLEELLEALSGDDDQRRENIAEQEQVIAGLEGDIAVKNELMAGKRAVADELSQQLDTTVQLRLEIEGKRTQNDRRAQEKNSQLLNAQGLCASLEQKKISCDMEENQIIDKLWENYELSRSDAQAVRQEVENMTMATKRVAELRREISRLGHVNVGAIEEYERVSERYEFLTGQRDDVAKSKRDLEKIINDLTGEMKTIFTEKFKEINESFRKVFLDLFGGGKAALILEDEENVLDCGIEIKVQPPGKAVTTISLLSGGEKSFVAIALYFAIMKVRPTPFCIMDEIDAALDEANVTRYAEYMRSMSRNTQFICITHHRATMEEADTLYGVTMQEKGVTTVISVDLEEAEKTIA